MSAQLLFLPVRHEWEEPATQPNQATGAIPMTRNLQTSGWIAFSSAVILLVSAAAASMAGGLHIEAGGVQLTLEASAERGLQLIFAAAQ